MDANRLGDTNHGFRRRSRSSGKDVEPDSAHRSKRCRPEEGQGKDRDLRGSGSDVGRRDRDFNQDVRGPDQCFKEHISVKEPTKELAYQSGKEPAPVSGHSPRINVSVSDQSDKKHMSVSHQSVRKLAHPSDGKLLSADKKALSISQHSSKPPISVAGKSSVPTECLVLENVFEKSVVLAFDESVKKFFFWHHTISSFCDYLFEHT
ncbi:hypothetical protein GQ55_5G057600 [Panicum hallii var. hallii]|uniref:Uncharacterized protein n=1 Tax=Panicum hallii var. hallii TaxID=1504633 RepID=A0A2T7DD41_9POAL|nr:hypothetical protein GQ55_5G057600 [Panicum hallii var. hallii]